MRQLIKVEYGANTSGYDFKITAIYQLNDKIHVITQLKTPTGEFSNALAHHQEKVVVKTHSAEPLEVIQYLINHKDNKEFESRPGYTDTTQEEVNEKFAQANILYQLRFDGLRGLRLSDFESLVRLKGALPFAEAAPFFNNTPPARLLNIYSAIEDDAVKLIFETVIAGDGSLFHDDIFQTLRSITENLAKESFSLEDDFFDMQDDRLVFEAYLTSDHSQAKQKFYTDAHEFYIPLNHPEKFFYFLLLADLSVSMGMGRHASSPTETHVQFSNDSILACFKELFVSNNRSRPAIENEMEVSIQDFVTKPGTLHQPASLFHTIAQAILKTQDIPQLNAIKAYLENFYKEFSVEDIMVLNRALFLLYFLSVRYYRSINISDIPLVDEAASILSNSKYYNLLKPFVTAFRLQVANKLLEIESYYYSNPDRCDWKCSEFEFIRTANFVMQTDGRIRISLQNNPVYQLHYSANAPKHGVFAAEMQRIVQKLGLQFAEDSDFNSLIIFTPESSLKLKAYGLHLNESILKNETHNVEMQEPTAGALLRANVISRVKSTQDEAEVFQTLLDANPDAVEIVGIMKQRNVLANHAPQNKFIVANLIHLLKQPKVNPNKLLELYRLLAPNLNADINEKILKLGESIDFSCIIDLLKRVSLNQAQCARLLNNPSVFARLWDISQKWDNSLSTFLLLLRPEINLEHISECSRLMTYGSYRPQPEWLNQETFNDIVNNISQCHDIIKGFDKLFGYKLLETHKQKFLQDPACANTFDELESWDVEDADTVALAVTNNPLTCKAIIAMNHSLNNRLISRNRGGHFFKFLVNQPDLIDSIAALGKAQQGAGDQNVRSAAYEKLKVLLKNVGFLRESLPPQFFSGKRTVAPSPSQSSPEKEDIKKQRQR